MVTSAEQQALAAGPGPAPDELGGDDFGAALEYLSGLLLDDLDLPQSMRRVAELVVDAVPSCDLASVTLLEVGREPRTVAATAPGARAIDEAQYAIGDGPCLRAARQNTVVRLSGASAWQEWPSVAQAAAQHEVASFMAAPLVVRSGAIGALNLFGFGAGAFDRLDEAALADFRRTAATSLANARLYAEAGAVADQMRAAMASRAAIEQAKGIVAVLNGVSVEQAFDLLRARSQETNVKLRTLAEQVVTTQRW